MAEFRQKVLSYIHKIPKGRVASYGQVAAACGKPRAARAVGGILRGLDAADGNIPWWRVVNNRGIISIKGNWIASKEVQKRMLEKEGIPVSDGYVLEIKKYRINNHAVKD